MCGDETRAHKLGHLKFAIFDLDGTLVDSRRDIACAILVGLERVGAPSVSEDRIFPLIGKPLGDMFERLLPINMKDKAESASEAYREHYFDHCADHSRLYPGVSGCLEALASVPIAIATTKMTFMAVQLVEKLGISHYFQCVQGSDGIPHKPDPTILRMVLGKLKEAPRDGIMVGDTTLDIIAGKRISMRTCGVTYGIGKREDLLDQGPDLLLDSLEGLPDLFSLSP